MSEYTGIDLASGEDTCMISMEYSEYQKLTDRIAELEALTQWQPIETAPKDGQRVLVCFVDNVHRKTWHINNSACQVATFRDYTGGPEFELSCESVSGYLNITLDKSAVTHWMEQPEPPEES